MKRVFSKLFLFLVLALTAAPQTQAQRPQTKGEKPKVDIQTNNSVQDFKLDSKLMSRQMPYRVLLPANYEISNEKTFYPVIYLLHGLTGHYDNWADKTRLKDYFKDFNYIIVMPEGNNGWYTDIATVANDKYESYIVRELIPEIDKKFRTKKLRENRAIAGLSMGGYGSIKFGMKYPEMFALVGSFSGALGAASWTEKELGGRKGAIPESLLSVFGNADNQIRPANDVFKMAREMPAEKIKLLPFIYQDCGTEDFLYSNNREFAALLQQRKIPHEYRELPGGHDWRFWESQIQEFLEVSERFLN